MHDAQRGARRKTLRISTATQEVEKIHRLVNEVLPYVNEGQPNFSVDA